jgi:hypothetical protein
MKRKLALFLTVALSSGVIACPVSASEISNSAEVSVEETANEEVTADETATDETTSDASVLAESSDAEDEETELLSSSSSYKVISTLDPDILSAYLLNKDSIVAWKKNENGVFKEGILSKDGTTVIADFVYEEISQLGTDYLMAKKDGKYGIIKSDGTVVVDFIYGGLDPDFENNLIIVSNHSFYDDDDDDDDDDDIDDLSVSGSDTLYGALDFKGNVIIPMEYNDLWIIENNNGSLKYYATKKIDKNTISYIISSDGSKVQLPQYSYRDMNAKAGILKAFYSNDDTWGFGYVDFSGKALSKFDYKVEPTNYSDDERAIVFDYGDSTASIIDKSQNIVKDISNLFEEEGSSIYSASYIGYDLFFCSGSKNAAVINSNGDVLYKFKDGAFDYADTEFIYDLISNSDSDAWVKTNEYLAISYSLLSNSDKEQTTILKYSDGKLTLVKTFSCDSYDLYKNALYVRDNYKEGVVFLDGTADIPTIYDQIDNYSDNYLYVEKDDKWGIIDKNNNTLVDFQFDSLSLFSENNTLYGYARKDGSMMLVEFTSLSASDSSSSSSSNNGSSSNSGSGSNSSGSGSSGSSSSSSGSSSSSSKKKKSGGGSSSKASSKTSESSESSKKAVPNTSVTTDDTTQNTQTTSGRNVAVEIGSNSITVDGETYDIDVPAYIQTSSSSTMVPLRVVSLAIASGDLADADNAKNIEWDADTKTATVYYNNNVIKFKAGSNQVIINGVAKATDNNATIEIKDGRMFVPFRTLGSALGVSVDWNSETRTAIFK